MARELRRPPELETAVRRVRVTSPVGDARTGDAVPPARTFRSGLSGVEVTVEHKGRLDALAADYVVMALPASTARAVIFEPPLPGRQQQALDRLRYGPAHRLLVQFAQPFWRRRRRPMLVSTPLPIGAVWDGNQEQRGQPGILTFLAGGGASAELTDLLDREGLDGVVGLLPWRERAAPPVAHARIAWEHDPWAAGGYAVFDTSFDPELREWLPRPAGPIVFAGEHTSQRWQGYMNGAIESGWRAAAEIRAMIP
jgi:monoamine oxidase